MYAELGCFVACNCLMIHTVYMHMYSFKTLYVNSKETNVESEHLEVRGLRVKSICAQW